MEIFPNFVTFSFIVDISPCSFLDTLRECRRVFSAMSGSSLYSRRASSDDFNKLVDVVGFDAVPTLTDYHRFTPTNPQSSRLLNNLIDFLQCLHQLLVIVAPDLVLRHQVPVDVVQL